ncbi:hypothetical protein SAMN04488505_103160 [Chitinophaga rupis]|jgi:hypothetical protein|uniref:Uncharacterized protein n=1 Tax=Chitinophaga rupis TaxID=573321 RepID=A0A1H7UZA5_9BACT|nr:MULTISPECIES: hypothetical protein [Chitinophaga]SEM02291.1 hypothetical protein SAMN04488505_103160 [Chitinophaga rupis]
MSLLNNNNKKGKKDKKQTPNAIPGATNFMKPNKAAGNAKKPMRTGGTRGS